MLREMLSEGSKISSKRVTLVFFCLLLALITLLRQFGGEGLSIPDGWYTAIVGLTELNVLAVLGDKGVAIMEAWKGNKPEPTKPKDDGTD